MLAIGLASFVISGSPIQRLIGIIFPAGVLWAFSKRQHIGSGDIKLTMAVGLYYGYLQAAIMLIGALLIIVCYARLFLKSTKRAKAKTVPFAPFITVICLIGFIYKHTLL
jgi:prepilin signal peptidase PulO-like enzyme (type II secretory pathway)